MSTVSLSATEERLCARLGCLNTIKVKPGHRPRKYCGNGCKQLMYLQREDEKRQEEKAQEQQAQHERDVTALRERYGPNELSAGVIDGLLHFRGLYGPTAAEQATELCALSSQEMQYRQSDQERELEEVRDR